MGAKGKVGAGVVAAGMVVAAALGVLNSRGERPVLCPKGLSPVVQIEALNRVLCSHGGDPSGPVVLAPPAEPAPNINFCTGDGKAGHRIHLIYVRSEGTPFNSSDIKRIRTAVGQADAYLDGSSGFTQHLRVLCQGTGKQKKLHVSPLACPPAEGNDVFGVISECMRGKGFDADRDGDELSDYAQGRGRIFVGFLKGYPKYLYGGQGTVGGSDSKDQAGRAPQYSIIQQFGGVWHASTFLHELGHNLGAVQLSAPHSTGAWHCVEGNDLLCYRDGGPQSGLYPVPCSGPSWQFDCGRDDYWDPGIPVGYLANHWNLADSPFLTRPR